MNATKSLAIISLLFSFAAAPTDRADKWRADLAMLRDELPKRHVDPFTKISKADFESSIAALDKRVDELADHEIVVGMMQIVALLGDAHTIIGLNQKMAQASYPIGFYFLKDGPFVAITSAEHRGLLRAKVVGIGSASFDDAAKRVATVFPWENESLYKQNLSRFMQNAQVLHALKLSDRVDRATFVLELADGSKKSVEFSPITPNVKPNLVRAPDWSKLKRPISMSPHNTKYWFEFDEPGKSIYVRYDACVDDPKYPFDKFCTELFAAIDSKNPSKLIVDLRNNGGGNSQVAQPLINGVRERKSVNEKGKLFVLIGRATFSSAQMNAQQFRDRTHATLIGEPTGQKPNHFGEIKTLTLPNSGLVVQYSTKFFKQSEKDEPSMMPDEVVEPTSEEFFGGKDIVLEQVLSGSSPSGRG